ncbi:MAG: sarcosine oxidase subunit alpha family protein [Pseudomonadota bacterium]
MTASRLPIGGRIDRSKPLYVTFDSRPLDAFAGDTLASALLANDEMLVGRSFKYHRPRGVFSAGVEEPNALVHLRTGGRHEPNARATMVEAFDGLVANAQNAWPSVGLDVGAANQLLAPFIGAGFYYKTFIGPFRGTRFWMFCERFIRRAAGMGSPGTLDDPDRYETVNLFCDVLVVGGGPAGLSAALAAGRTGAQVVLVEQDAQLGGALLSTPVDGPSDAWLEAIRSELSAMPNVRVLTRSTVFGAYDHDVYGVVERVWDHVAVAPEDQPRQRYAVVRTKRTVLATGAIERPMVFGGNDRPGVMLAGSVRAYVNRYAVLPGQRVVLATNNDSAYATARDLAAAGADVTLVDARHTIPDELLSQSRAEGVELRPGSAVLSAKGRGRVTGAIIVPVSENGRASAPGETIACDLIAVSGGWSPTLHLWSQRQQKPVFDAKKACFVPAGDTVPTMTCAGDAQAAGGVSAAIEDGFSAGKEAAIATGATNATGYAPEAPEPWPGDDWTRGIAPLWTVTKPDGKPAGKAFVDLQHDVTTSDIDLAHREGYQAVEHLKRYTTTGMATDQGKLSNVNALARMAQLRDAEIADVGTTTFRPPYTPITIGALAGNETGHHFRATRLTTIDGWHRAHGAVMTEAGAWLRPWYYRQAGEDVRAAYIREAAHVRQHVGIVDVSTLGKVAVQGPDAAEFLNRIYVNGWKTLPVGRLRYGVMLREDGFVLDDGATARLGEHDYFMSTTTANAAPVLAFAERLLQTAWTDLEVHVTSVTDQWAAIAVAGPKARDLLTAVVGDADLSRDALPNNHFTHGRIDGTEVRVHRMSYSGELAYELYVPALFGRAVWEALIAAGDPFNLKPYGTEAMGALRVEKGHVAGPELEGRTTLKDLGLEGFASAKKPFVGSVLRNRPALTDADRPTLVGLEIDGELGALPGSLLFAADGPTEGHGEGWVSSTTYSPALGKNIAMGLLKNGPSRMGETVRVVDFVGDRTLKATVVSHHFFDPKGERQNA